MIPAVNSPLEGWSFLTETYDEATAYQSQVFEGLYEWLFHSSAYAENEWASTDPWNAPTSFTLAPGANRTYGLQFILADSIPTIEDALIDAGHPVAAGIPGYILPADQTAKLFLKSPSTVADISVTPAGALTWSENSDSDSWVGYDITPVAWGRARLSITYADGRLQTVHYYVTHDAVQTIADMGEFLTTEAWYDDTSDPFGRAPSIITYDREANEQVLNDPRVWISGLSDEGGVGAWLAEAMKLWLQPNDAEVQKFEMFINETVWGTLQNSDGSVKKVSCLARFYPNLIWSSPYSITHLEASTTTIHPTSIGGTGGLGIRPARMTLVADTTTFMLSQRTGPCIGLRATIPAFLALPGTGP